jgi:SAM-dependent methyltransferase
MRLTDGEFRVMNSPLRRLLQRGVEFPLFRRLGLRQSNQDILEIGCGSGYGAVLLARLRPKSYLGIDLMPEQIQLARQRPGLPRAEFRVMDAAEMADVAEASKDCVVVFGILHHVPKWREVLRECHRVLRPGGRLFLEEPPGRAVALWDKLFQWNHPKDALFEMSELEDQLTGAGFRIVKRFRLFPFRLYCAEKPPK